MNIAEERVSFTDRIIRILERTEYRRADTQEEKAAIFRMRHEAYARNGSIEVRPSGMFHDAFDESPNVWLMGVFIDGELASSIRIHVSASLDVPLPAATRFSDLIGPHLREKRCVIDISRHVNRLEFTRRFPEMPYITVRPNFLAEQYFEADYITAAVRTANQLAFKRMFAAIPWSTPREYPPLSGLWALMAYDCKGLKTKTYQRYPFYIGGSGELRGLFGHSSNSLEDARRAIRWEKANEVGELQNQMGRVAHL